MIGTLRLSLAIVVVFYHAGVTIGGIRPGISAVVAFFLISGYAMSGLGRRFYAAPGTVRAFYADRLARLLPQYYFWAALTAVVVFVGRRRWFFHAGPADAVNIAANLTIVPLDLYPFVPRIARLVLIPPAWSLGLELCFYACVPLLLRSRVAVWMVAGLGLAVLALAAQGALDPELFAYRLLPGTLPWFLLGWALERRDRALLATLGLALGAIFASVWWHGLVGRGVLVEVAIGGGAGLLLLVGATRLRSGALDRLLGEGAYGVYLGHVAFLTVVGAAFAPAWRRGAIVAAIAVGAGFLSWYAVERPVNAWRRRARPPATPPPFPAPP